MKVRRLFKAWEREPVERIFSRFNGGLLHLHGNGRHFLKAACREEA